jgi:hypothetical protein
MAMARGGALMTRRIGSLRRSIKSLPAICIAAAALAAVQLMAMPGTSLAATPAPASASASGIKPAGELDCNGYSPVQHAVKLGGTICAEVHANGQLKDNGWYIGHDEPTMQFYSKQPGSSTNITWVQTLPRDPAAAPTVLGPGKDVTHFFELMPALWYSMALCDPRSYPQTPCTPDSDSNSPSATSPGGGSAFLELQFYPPGFAPFVDGLSCDGTHWCAALTIDSLECTNGFTSCNNDCEEPVNAAFIQTNGVPTGPPSPQEADVATFTPNRSTLLMNPGDKLKIQIFDNKAQGALETRVRDLSNGQTGFMLASAANGFMNTSITDCSGTPWSFRPLYSTASTINQGGWAAANINVAYEIGHFTPCTSLSGRTSIPVGSYDDPSWQECNGPYENTAPPDGTGSNAETSDFPCFPAGDTHGPLNSAPDRVTGCLAADLDYDGTSYWSDWPDSVTPNMFPSAMTIQPPVTGRGTRYTHMQFLTDNAATNSLCNPASPTDCVVPPPQAPGQFYPYWTLARVHGACVWEFGQMTNGKTFGGAKQYGTFTDALGLAENASPIRPNPHC